MLVHRMRADKKFARVKILILKSLRIIFLVAHTPFRPAN
jgi:hypothetical protein